MSTRTNIIVKVGNGKPVYIYRHSDGYPASTGVDLVEKIRACQLDPAAFLQAIFAEKYDATSYRKERPVYELTDSVHGDIEWLYLVQFNGSEPVTCAAMACGYSSPGTYIDQSDAARVIRAVELDDFIRMVNKEIRDTNKRGAELRIKGHGMFQDWQPEPELMLEHPPAAMNFN